MITNVLPPFLWFTVYIQFGCHVKKFQAICQSSLIVNQPINFPLIQQVILMLELPLHNTFLSQTAWTTFIYQTTLLFSIQLVCRLFCIVFIHHLLVLYGRHKLQWVAECVIKMAATYKTYDRSQQQKHTFSIQKRINVT